MREPRGFTIASLLLACLSGGCLSPGTIKPIANDNLQNVQYWRANSQVLHREYKQLVAAMGKLELIHRLETVSLALNEFTDPVSGAVKTNDLAKKVTELTDLVTANQKVMSNDEWAAFKERIALENPVIGDIAAEFIPRGEVESIIPVAFATWQSKLPSRTKVEAAEPYLSRFYLAKNWKRSLADTMEATDKYLQLLDRQGELAEGHAKAFVTFSDSKAHFAETVGRMLSDTELQTSIGQLVQQNTNDPKRRAAAETLLKSLGTISDATSDPNLKK
jgi:hypothetical protein